MRQGQDRSRALLGIESGSMKTTVATRAHVSAAGEGEKGARGFPLLDWAEKEENRPSGQIAGE